jgi:hypothetical protein
MSRFSRVIVKGNAFLLTIENHGKILLSNGNTWI